MDESIEKTEVEEVQGEGYRQEQTEKEEKERLDNFDFSEL